jgi:predicted transcriptional regulator
MARRRKNIDPEQVRKLAGLGLTQKDMASFVGCSQSLISLRFSSSYNLGVTQLKTGLNKVMGRNRIAWV